MWEGGGDKVTLLLLRGCPRPTAAEDDEDGEDPSLELNQRMGAEGILAAIMGPAARQLGFSLPAGLEWAEFDYFHDLILAEECQAGSIAQTLPIPFRTHKHSLCAEIPMLMPIP